MLRSRPESNKPSPTPTPGGRFRSGWPSARERRDNHTCRFPTCASTRRLHAHHIVHWADSGPTDLDNLMLLCSFHHRLVHEGGWTLTGTATNHRITRPDGTPLPTADGHHPSAKPPDLDTIATVADPNGLFARAGAGERYDHNYAVDVTWTVNDHHRKRFRGTVADDQPTTQRAERPRQR